MAQLGGTAIPLTPDELQLSRGESLPDTARALSRYLDVLAVRTHAHAELEAWAEWATIPVINALTADEHPCQALADALTIRDRLGALDGVRVAWVGDGSNVLVSLAALGELLGYEVVAACPDGLRAGSANLALTVVRDPREAVARRRRRRHRHVDQHGPGARARAAARRPRAVPARRRAARRGVAPTRSSCTACRRTRARRSRRACSTARARRSGTRRRTACTSRRRCSRCCWGV